MQLSIQTSSSYEAKPGDGGPDDRYQAALIPSGGSGRKPRRRFVVEQKVDKEATLSSTDRSGSEADSRFCVAPSPPPSGLEQHRRTPREERDGGVGHVDERELDSFRGHRSCPTFGHIGFAVLGQCQLLGC